MGSVAVEEDPIVAAAEKKLVLDLSPFIKVYDDGSFERLSDTPYVPPIPRDPTTGVSSKDVDVDPPVRIFLPEIIDPGMKLPILLHFHAGGFMVGSIFSAVDLQYLNALSSRTNTLIVAVEYRLVPESRLPAAYDDALVALNWVCSHAVDEPHVVKDPWISNHGDFTKIFIDGDSAGANIAYNLGTRLRPLALPGNLEISGLIVSHPMFCGSTPIGKEFEGDIHQDLRYQVWSFCYPNVPGGIDSPLINPLVDDDASLSSMGRPKTLIAVAENDILKLRAMALAEKLQKSGKGGSAEIVMSAGEGHCFHVFNPHSEKSVELFAKFTAFIHSS